MPVRKGRVLRTFQIAEESSDRFDEIAKSINLSYRATLEFIINGFYQGKPYRNILDAIAFTQDSKSEMPPNVGQNTKYPFQKDNP